MCEIKMLILIELYLIFGKPFLLIEEIANSNSPETDESTKYNHLIQHKYFKEFSNNKTCKYAN